MTKAASDHLLEQAEILRQLEEMARRNPHLRDAIDGLSDDIMVSTNSVMASWAKVLREANIPGKAQSAHT